MLFLLMVVVVVAAAAMPSLFFLKLLHVSSTFSFFAGWSCNPCVERCTLALPPFTTTSILPLLLLSRSERNSWKKEVFGVYYASSGVKVHFYATCKMMTHTLLLLVSDNVFTQFAHAKQFPERGRATTDITYNYSRFPAMPLAYLCISLFP